MTSCFEERFGKGTLQAASQFEFSSMTRENKESLEQWQTDRVIETTYRALGARVHRLVLQEQTVLLWATWIYAQAGD